MVAGFGIRTPQHVADIKAVADGIVIGSEIVKRFKANTREEIIEYLQSINAAKQAFGPMLEGLVKYSIPITLVTF
ncbi:tryptophan synthase subunit alpha, partial [Staphylococcus aureus]